MPLPTMGEVMNKRASVSLFAAFLSAITSGCASNVAESRRQRDVAYCRSLGVPDGAQLAQCAANQDLARTQRSLAAIQAGNALIQASQPRPVTATTCNRFGGQVVCNTY